MDTIDVDYINYFYGTSMCSRSRISDIIQYHQYLIILSRKGACQVLDGQTYQRHMFLNPTKFDTVQTVFVNRVNCYLSLIDKSMVKTFFNVEVFLLSSSFLSFNTLGFLIQKILVRVHSSSEMISF